MTTTEYITHMSLWCLLKAPLIMGNDLRNASKDTIMVLSNKEVHRYPYKRGPGPLDCMYLGDRYKSRFAWRSRHVDSFWIGSYVSMKTFLFMHSHSVLFSELIILLSLLKSA